MAPILNVCDVIGYCAQIKCAWNTGVWTCICTNAFDTDPSKQFAEFLDPRS